MWAKLKKTECRPATGLALLRESSTIQTTADNVATLLFVAFTRVVWCKPCEVTIRYGKDAQRARSGGIFPARPRRRERETEWERERERCAELAVITREWLIVYLCIHAGLFLQPLRRASSRTAVAAAAAVVGARKSHDRCTCLILANFAAPRTPSPPLQPPDDPKSPPLAYQNYNIYPFLRKLQIINTPKTISVPLHTHTHIYICNISIYIYIVTRIHRRRINFNRSPVLRISSVQYIIIRLILLLYYIIWLLHDLGGSR